MWKIVYIVSVTIGLGCIIIFTFIYLFMVIALFANYLIDKFRKRERENKEDESSFRGGDSE